MRCHQINIEADWLYNKMDLYDVYLEDAFQIMVLSEKEKGNQTTESKNIIEAKSYDPNVQVRPPGATREYVDKICISQQQRDLVYTFYKMGKFFKRPSSKKFCRLELNEIKQLSSETSTKVTKSYKNYDKIEVDQKTKPSQDFPWNQDGNDKSRLIFRFKQQLPITIYFPTIEEATKFKRYFFCQGIIETEGGPILQKLLSHFTVEISEKFQYQWIIWLEGWFKTYASQLYEQRRRDARLDKQREQFVRRIDDQLVRFSIDSWKFKCLKAYNEEQAIEQKKREDEERKKREEEFQRKRKEDLERLKQSQLLESAQAGLTKVINRLRKEEEIMEDFIREIALKTEFLYNCKNIKDYSFSITFRTILIPKEAGISRPLIELSLYGNREKQTVNMMKDKNINENFFHVLKAGKSIFCQMKMAAWMKESTRSQFCHWDVKENILENFTGANLKIEKVQSEGVTLAIQNYTHEDYIDISLRDQLAFQDENQSDQVSLQLKDIFYYNIQSRTVWAHILFKNKFIVPIEIDIHSYPSEQQGQLKKQMNTYDIELYRLCSSNSPIVDPIYHQLIKLPVLYKNVIKVFLKVMEERNDNFKSFLSKFAVFIGSSYIVTQTKLEDDNDDFIAIKKFFVRQLVENICMTMNRVSQLKWEQLLKLCEVASHSADQAFSFLLLQKTLSNRHYYLKIASDLESYIYNGISPKIRPGIWFSLMHGQNQMEKFRHLINSNFEFHQRKDLDEQTWIYLQFRENVPKNEGDQQQQSVFETFLFYCKLINREVTKRFVPVLQKITEKLISLVNQHYIQDFGKMTTFNDEEFQKFNNKQGITNYEKNEEITQRHEAISFFLLICFCNSILEDYPVFNNSKKIRDEYCSYLIIHIKQENEKVIQILKSHDIDFETIFYNIMINLYCDIFYSELLFIIWDIIILETLKNQQAEIQRKNYIIPSILGMIIDQLQNKVLYLYSDAEFLEAIKVQANFLSFSDVYQRIGKVNSNINYMVDQKVEIKNVLEQKKVETNVQTANYMKEMPRDQDDLENEQSDH